MGFGVADARAKALITKISLAIAAVVDASIAPKVRAHAMLNSAISFFMVLMWVLNRTKLWLASRDKATRGCFAFAILSAALPAHAEPRTPVNIELVLALDSSASVDRDEFKLQLEGLAQAFRDPEVGRAVDNLRPFGVAIAVVQWGGPGETKLIIPFIHLENARDAKAFGFRMSHSFRWIRASTTSIATAIDNGRTLLLQNEFDGQRLVIDVSGDGKDNSDVSIVDARQRAKEASIIVNGLAIEAEEKTLSEYYEKNVIIGANAFVETADGFEDFQRAIIAKLVRELRPLGS